MKIHLEAQNTLPWMRLHIGIPTASGLDNLLDTKFELRSGETPKTYLCKKIAEAFRGRPLHDDLNVFNVDQGMIIESEARPWLSLHLDLPISSVGFITTDDGKAGCSPDGIIQGKKEQVGVEIKCPAAHTHVKYLLGGVVPKEYVAQVHGSMYVTGFKHWVFLSYRRGFPPLLLKIERDEEIIEKIGQAVTSFHEKFSEGLAVLHGIAGTGSGEGTGGNQATAKQEQSSAKV